MLGAAVAELGEATALEIKFYSTVTLGAIEDLGPCTPSLGSSNHWVALSRHWE